MCANNLFDNLQVGLRVNIILLVISEDFDDNSMVGALNKLPVAASGMIFFNDAVTMGSVSAISVGCECLPLRVV